MTLHVQADNENSDGIEIARRLTGAEQEQWQGEVAALFSRAPQVEELADRHALAYPRDIDVQAVCSSLRPVHDDEDVQQGNAAAGYLWRVAKGRERSRKKANFGEGESVFVNSRDPPELSGASLFVGEYKDKLG